MSSNGAPTGRDRAYAYLRDRVLTAPDVQGSFLNEQEVAGAIGVSRTPVREALLMLAADGLVEMIPQRGAYVPRVTPRQITEMMALRGILEREAARHSMQFGVAPVDKMRAILDEQRALTELSDMSTSQDFIALDRDFHQCLVDAMRNQLISTTYAGLRTRQVLVGVVALFRTSHRREEVCTEHDKIIEAITGGDIDDACAAIDEHLDITLGILHQG